MQQYIRSPVEKAKTVAYERRKNGDNIKMYGIKIIIFYDSHDDTDEGASDRKEGRGKHFRNALLVFRNI